MGKYWHCRESLIPKARGSGRLGVRLKEVQGQTETLPYSGFSKKQRAQDFSRSPLSEVLVLCVSIATLSMKMPSLLNNLLIQPHNTPMKYVWRRGYYSLCISQKLRRGTTTHQRSGSKEHQIMPSLEPLYSFYCARWRGNSMAIGQRMNLVWGMDSRVNEKFEPLGYIA